MNLLEFHVVPNPLFYENGVLLFANLRQITDDQYTCSEIVISTPLGGIVLAVDVSFLEDEYMILDQDSDISDPDYGSYFKANIYLTHKNYRAETEFSGRFGASNLQKILGFENASLRSLNISKSNMGSWPVFEAQFRSSLSDSEWLRCSIAEHGIFRITKGI